MRQAVLYRHEISTKTGAAQRRGEHPSGGAGRPSKTSRTHELPLIKCIGGNAHQRIAAIEERDEECDACCATCMVSNQRTKSGRIKL